MLQSIILLRFRIGNICVVAHWNFLHHRMAIDAFEVVFSVENCKQLDLPRLVECLLSLVHLYFL